ncbi:Hypothetical Protein FCC1311_027882 [Hondaea fermentalgiana]|uniref:GST N-terminal domain-containing protein n=1 Tax=Hondaea fermentalgiana TaxID=2315210 RepID=A0A2R5G685_9STRA|nr:Hypothetical Protein FCC1311_027882 [Hondaea fermentalgiana]|eukprot:GBG26567.1 Hypothetical Protein FCC1311_027882 [Hondaea fermentalgiana]
MADSQTKPGDEVTLLGMEQSAYTGKAHAYLRYKGVPLRLVTASADVYRKVILPHVGWAVVPVVLDVDGTVVQDTTVIIDHFERKLGGDRPVIPATPRQRLVSSILETFGDQWLIMAGMHYRWSFPEQLDYLAHEWDRAGQPARHAKSSPQDAVARIKLARRNMTQFSGMLPGLGVSPETIPGIEATYKFFLEAMTTHLQQHRYLLGDAPCAGDFGLITFLYAHLYRDPVPGKMMKESFPAVAEYVERVRGFAHPGPEQSHTFDDTSRKFSSEPVGAAGFLSDDQIPRTLMPILRLFCSDHLPILLNTVDALKRYIAEHPDKLSAELPRGLGSAHFQIGGHSGSRAVQSFDAWKFQRIVDVARADPSCRTFLSEIGPHALAIADVDLSKCRLVKPPGPNRKSTLYLEKYVSSSM